MTTVKSITVEVPDDTQEISGVIISGDMVMESPVHADSSEGRMINFYDGRFHISRKNFDKLAAPGLSSYEAQELD